jgi:hypothetical protein
VQGLWHGPLRARALEGGRCKRTVAQTTASTEYGRHKDQCKDALLKSLPAQHQVTSHNRANGSTASVLSQPMPKMPRTAMQQTRCEHRH